MEAWPIMTDRLGRSAYPTTHQQDVVRLGQIRPRPRPSQGFLEQIVSEPCGGGSSFAAVVNEKKVVSGPLAFYRRGMGFGAICPLADRSSGLPRRRPYR
ncbi:hypothetical protein V2G26_013601 [Clonostachys chloroleuca]